MVQSHSKLVPGLVPKRLSIESLFDHTRSNQQHCSAVRQLPSVTEERVDGLNRQPASSWRTNSLFKLSRSSHSFLYKDCTKLANYNRSIGMPRIIIIL